MGLDDGCAWSTVEKRRLALFIHLISPCQSYLAGLTINEREPSVVNKRASRGMSYGMSMHHKSADMYSTRLQSVI